MLLWWSLVRRKWHVIWQPDLSIVRFIDEIRGFAQSHVALKSCLSVLTFVDSDFSRFASGTIELSLPRFLLRGDGLAHVLFFEARTPLNTMRAYLITPRQPHRSLDPIVIKQAAVSSGRHEYCYTVRVNIPQYTHARLRRRLPQLSF